MREREPLTQTMKASEARQQFSQVLNKVFRGQTRVLVEKSGIPVAAIVSAQDLERLRQLDAQRAERFKVIDEMRAAFADAPEEELERELDQALSEVRAEQAGPQRARTRR
ncbi:MAG: type II toxin-antitoxin system prevent-host-death family antitoxin [Armatimonadetes bacterium]|nr:type II toxin-antitoxin system prevent-host-death family antitoxin [Armatimonadota bacterium]